MTDGVNFVHTHRELLKVHRAVTEVFTTADFRKTLLPDGPLTGSAHYKNLAKYIVALCIKDPRQYNKLAYMVIETGLVVAKHFLTHDCKNDKEVAVMQLNHAYFELLEAYMLSALLAVGFDVENERLGLPKGTTESIYELSKPPPIVVDKNGYINNNINLEEVMTIYIDTTRGIIEKDGTVFAVPFASYKVAYFRFKDIAIYKEFIERYKEVRAHCLANESIHECDMPVQMLNEITDNK